MSAVLVAAAGGLNEYQRRFSSEIHERLRVGLEFEGGPTAPNMEGPGPGGISSARPCTDSYDRINADITTVLQPYQIDFTPQGTVEFDSVNTRLERAKIDIQIDADDLDKLRVRWQADSQWQYWYNQDPVKWSFAAWMYVNRVIPQALDDLNGAAWAGEAVAPTAGTPGTPLESFTGYRKRIADSIAGGSVVPVPVGAVNPNTMVDHVRDFMAGLPDAVRDMPGRIIMSDQLRRAHLYDHQSRYGTGAGVAGNDDLGNQVFGFRARIQGVKAMTGSNRFIFAPDGIPSLIHGTMIGEGMPLPSIRWESFERKLKGMMEIHRFFDFEHPYITYVSDQV